MKKSVAIALLAVIFTQCKKDSALSAPPDYVATGTGSTFTYHFASDSVNTDFTLTATSRDTSVSGRSYRVFSSTDSVNRYFAKDGHNYYKLSAIPNLAITPADLYLKDDAALNTSWAGDAVTFHLDSVPFPLIANFNNTIKEKGISRTVSGKTYNDVIHVRQDIDVTFAGSIGGLDRYYAPGVGLIEEDTHISISVTVPVSYSFSYNSTQTLTTYEIK